MTATSVLVRLTLRHWAATLGTSPGRLAVLGAAVTVAVGWAAHVAAGPLTDPTPAPEAILLALALALFAATAAAAIVGTQASVLPPQLGFLRGLPVPPSARRRAAAGPVLALGVAIALALGPVAVRVAATHAGYGAPPAAIGVVLVGLGGITVGRLLWAVSHRAFAGPGVAGLRLTGAFVLWLAWLAASLAWPPHVLATAGWPGAVVWMAPLVWPTAWWALVEPSDLRVAIAVLTVAGAWVLGHRLRARDDRPPPRTRVAVRPARFATAAPVALAALLTVVRLRRHPRTLEALVVSGFLALVTVLAGGWVRSRAPVALEPTTVAVLGSQVAAGSAVLVRGLSSRARPAEGALGIRAADHVLGAWMGTTLLAALTSLPALAAALLWVDPAAALLWVAVLPLHTALAVAVSTALVPSVGHGGAEASAVLAYALLDTLVIRGLGPASPAGLALALLAAVTLEHRHRTAR